MIDLDRVWRRYAGTIPGLLERRPDFRFDPSYCAVAAPDMAGGAEALTEHYEDRDRPGTLPPNLYAQLQSAAPQIDRVLGCLVTDPELSAAAAAGQPGACELAFELIHLGSPVDAAVSDFSMAAYLELHDDILRARMDPLTHYVLYGYKEGRRILGDLRTAWRSGRVKPRADRPTCLIAVHECSRTGAPTVGLQLAREAALTHNVIVAALRDGPLLEAFRDVACEVLVSAAPSDCFDLHRCAIVGAIDFAILNSIECWVYTLIFVQKEIPFCFYIHEYAQYTFPAYKSTLAALSADILIFSSEHVLENWRGRLLDIRFDIDRDSAVIPQRDLGFGGVTELAFRTARERLSRLLGRDLTSTRLICGAGQLQWRKGVDIFTMTAQICRRSDAETVFVWIGDGLNAEDMTFGVWMDYHLRQVGVGRSENNLFLLPAGSAYPDVLAASDAMFLSSRLDPLPNVVFDALDAGCRIVLFEGASGFGDPVYRASEHFCLVDYADPAAAAAAILNTPRKTPTRLPPTAGAARPPLFSRLREALMARLRTQRYFVRGASQIDAPMLFTSEEKDRRHRVREREKMLRYGRRLVWRDLDDVGAALAASDNWVHGKCRLAPYAAVESGSPPDYSIHVHAYYTDDLAKDLACYRAFREARRIVMTTDAEAKAEAIHEIAAGVDMKVEVVVTPNRGRDILPFMNLFRDGGAAGDDEIWCHLHQKKSVATTTGGDLWRRFLMRILLGDETELSSALTAVTQPGVGLAAPFDPYFIGWTESRRLLDRLAPRLPGPMPENPLLFPVGNMFWCRRTVVLAMNDVFGPDYPWPNEPIATDGTEFHLIERLWPAMAAHAGLESMFVHKLDERRA